MKTLDLFVVELKTKVNDTITTEGGMELFIDTRFEMGEFNNRITEGPVVCAPIKHNTGVKKGDTLYFHHHVVINDGQPLTGNDDNYIVRYDPDNTHGNQAIAFKCKDTGEVRPLAGWALLESVEEEEEKESEVVEVIKLEEKMPRRGRVSFDAPWLEELGVKKGDIVGFAKNADYRINIDGKEHYRTRNEDLVYVEE